MPPASGMSPYLTTITNSTGNETENSTVNQLANTKDLQMNQFTGQQQGLQNQSLGFIGSILSGQSPPPNFGMPQVVYDAAMANFNKYQAPMLAAQHGAGSPVINSAMQELQLQLAGQGAQRSMGNALDAYRMAANYAFAPAGSLKTIDDVFNKTETGEVQRTDNFVNTGEILGRLIEILQNG